LQIDIDLLLTITRTADKLLRGKLSTLMTLNAHNLEVNFDEMAGDRPPRPAITISAAE